MAMPDSQRYPKVSFVSTSIKDNGNELIINGELNFHGVKREQAIKSKDQVDKDISSLNESFNILIKLLSVPNMTSLAVSITPIKMANFKGKTIRKDTKIEC